MSLDYWNKLKSNSKWHFDTSRAPLPGADSFTYVGNFDRDFGDEIDKATAKAVVSTWGERHPEKPDLAHTSPMQADLASVGANVDMPLFDRVKVDNIPVFMQIAEELGLVKPTINFDNQRTGQMLVEHFDNFEGRRKAKGPDGLNAIDRDPAMIRRFAVMLADWELGQVFQLGNAHFTQWKKGDCITWEWKDMPHSTCNMGWEDRPMLQINGKTTQKTLDILANCTK